MSQVNPFAAGFLPNTLSPEVQTFLAHHTTPHLLAMLLANLGLMGGSSGTVSLAGSTKTANYTIPAGFASVGLLFSDDFTGSVAGVAVDGSVDPPMDISAPGAARLGSIALVVSAGNVRIFTVG